MFQNGKNWVGRTERRDVEERPERDNAETQRAQRSAEMFVGNPRRVDRADVGRSSAAPVQNQNGDCD